MKRIIKCIVYFTILCGISIYFSACAGKVSEQRDRSEICIDNNIEVYRVPYEELDCDFKDGDYLVIEDAQGGSVLYIPDCYGEIIDVSVKPFDIDIRHIDLVDNRIEECTIPIILSHDETNNVVEIVSGRDKRVLMDAKEEDLPLLIWSEEFEWENELYETKFERISPVYRGIFIENGDLLADYSIRVMDENGDLISEQILTNFPVQYEEMYWLIDFSGDGFPDLAFCTQYTLARLSSTTTRFLIWDTKESSYQLETVPLSEIYCERMFRPLWNAKLSAILFFASGGAEDRANMYMYAYSDNEWTIVRKLEPVYEESEYEETEAPKCIGYKETVYKDNKVIHEQILEHEGLNAIWFDANSVWCKDNIENIQLYPGEEWQEITVRVNGIAWEKYVRR